MRAQLRHRLVDADLGGALGHALDVAAGAKRAARAGQHDGADGFVRRETGQRLQQRIHHRRRQRIEPVRPVERQQRDAVRHGFDQLLFHRRTPYAGEASGLPFSTT
jgi:hypothetical protein